MILLKMAWFVPRMTSVNSVFARNPVRSIQTLQILITDIISVYHYTVVNVLISLIFYFSDNFVFRLHLALELRNLCLLGTADIRISYHLFDKLGAFTHRSLTLVSWLY